jgi:hypothetical protein
MAGLVAIVAVLTFGASSAHGITIRAFAAGPTLTQAGGHPDLNIAYSGESREDPQLGGHCQCNDPRNIDISLPTGFIGNPHATPQCKAADFAADMCPADSQVGVVAASVYVGGGIYVTDSDEPIYNSVPRPNQAGLLAMKLVPGFFDIPLYSVLSARTGSDYGLDANTDDLQRQFSVQGFHLTLWGVPADPIHDALRMNNEVDQKRPWPSNSPLTPFLQNPSTCSTTLSSTVKVTGYDDSVTSADAPWPTSTGCDQLSFNPSISAKPTTTAADSASGVDIDLTVPQLLSPTFPSPSEIRAASVKLPVGFSINPNAADGKTSCSDVAANIGTGSPAAAVCPEFAKVGTDEIDSSALPQPVPGGIYIGDPQPGNRYRILLTADGFATHIKLAGSIKLDPVTGQLTATFDNLPQSPLTEFNMHFFGAERGLLATPTQCGTYAVQSTFTPWDETLPSQSATQFFSLDSGPSGAPCPGPTRPFNPAFKASSSGNTAGAHSPFSIDLGRNDGDQDLSALDITTPPGFSATIAGIPYCSEGALLAAAEPSSSGLSQQALPSCPFASQIGTSVTGAGAGTHPVYLGGKVYLAGPYKGAPLSLAVITPAVSGPYDLGNVVVRAALHVNPSDAHITSISDPLPRIVDGIPLRLRSIKINLDRPDFALNPTNCDPFEVAARIFGDQGSEADRSSHFQVANCARLDFDPKLALRLTGGTKRRGHPALHATLTPRPGDANIASASVALPASELLDQAHLSAPCTGVQFAASQCPAGSVIGQAKATSPLLGQPLSGNVYLVTGSNKLPDVVAALRGQIDINLRGKVDTAHQALRTTFRGVPDTPVSSFTLDLLGGRKGLLVNSKSICSGVGPATVHLTGQNGRRANRKVALSTPCGKASRHRRNHSGDRR